MLLQLTGNKSFDAWEHAYYLRYKNVRPPLRHQALGPRQLGDVAARHAAATATGIGV
jgi:hypothetical protein